MINGSVVERVLSKFKAIPPRFLEKLVKKPQLLESLPLAIKQQVSLSQIGVDERTCDWEDQAMASGE
jgi:hypothetical protein